MCLLSGAIFALCANTAHAQDAKSCGSLQNNYGPHDYRKITDHQRRLVEDAHFTPGVESLTRMKTSYFSEDIGYTLRVFPNHHRALITMQRLVDREKTDKPAHAQWSMACYFERAIRFQADDHIVRMLFASYLIKNARLDEATWQLETAIKLNGDDPFTQFNAGLIFFDMKNYERALVQAHRAARLGLPRTELKDQLMAVGKWSDLPANQPNESKKP